MNKNSEDTFSLEILHDPPKKKSPWLLYLGATIILVVVLSYTAYDFFDLGNRITSAATPTPSVTPSAPSPTPTPTVANLDKSKLSIKVLNGGGKAGAASTMKDVLEKAGYTVSSTGNADSYDYDQTEIHVSTDNKQYLDALKKDLSTSYTVGTADTNYSGSGAEVIVGKE